MDFYTFLGFVSAGYRLQTNTTTLSEFRAVHTLTVRDYQNTIPLEKSLFRYFQNARIVRGFDTRIDGKDAQTLFIYERR